MSQAYFDRISSNYLVQCKTGLLSLYRNKEAQGLRTMLLEYYPENFEGKILDVGCGAGYHASYLRELYPSLHFTGVDPSEGMIKEYRKLGIRAVNNQVEQLASNSIEFFDIILVLGVLEFVEDLNLFIQSLRTLSRNESRIFVIVPKAGLSFGVYYLYHKIKGTIRFRSPKNYIESFKNHNFKLVNQVSLTSLSDLMVFDIEKK